MKTCYAILTGVLLAGLTSCYQPELAPAAFLCGEGGACPEGYKCYGGICMDSKPECMMDGYIFDGNQDRDLEPNNTAQQAVTLPCGNAPDDPAYSPCQCPPIPTAEGFRRKFYNNGFPGLAICPRGDYDYYRFYLLAGESLQVNMIHKYNLGRDLNMEVGIFNSEEEYIPVAEAKSTNDNETLLVEATQRGWHYIVVKPARTQDELDQNGQVARPADVNEYVIQFDLNPDNVCNNNGVCDVYETPQSCSSDCQGDSYCGNNVCEQAEMGQNACPADCVCGNGTCDVHTGETPTSCPQDCPSDCS